MTVAELIKELEGKHPDALVVIDVERKGWWSLDVPNGLQDKWVTYNRNTYDYDSAEEGADGASLAVRIW